MSFVQGLNHRDLIPFAEPDFYQGSVCPHLNESHHRLGRLVREFIERDVNPNLFEWEEAGEIPRNIYVTMASLGLTFLSLGNSVKKFYVPNEVTSKIYEGGYEPDVFHTMVATDELSRTGSLGFCWGIAAGLTIGLPPVATFGSEELKRRVLPDVLSGKKIICLCVTEPSAGSDVANLKTTAKKTADGKHYIVNGEKKWITNGIWADYFTVAVRTGEPGMKGLSFLLIERSMAGVETKRMKCSGAWCSGTTYITFSDVKVPVANLIGKEGRGFKYIVHNFNFERTYLGCLALRMARVCYEDSWKHAIRRLTFGVPLMNHPVIRLKLADMVKKIESSQAWLTRLYYQLHTMDSREGDPKLGGVTALLKVHAGKTLEFCAREAGQVFGGLSYSRGGLGERVERMSREVKAMLIPGGSEEIMTELGVRMSRKLADTAKTMLDGSKTDPGLQRQVALARAAGMNVDMFGDGLPFGDAYWYQGYNSLYYGHSHKTLRESARKVDFSKSTGNQNLKSAWEKSGVSWALAGLDRKQNTLLVDSFHSLVAVEELGRFGMPYILFPASFGYGIASRLVSKLFPSVPLNGTDFVVPVLVDCDSFAQTDLLKCCSIVLDQGDNTVSGSAIGVWGASLATKFLVLTKKVASNDKGTQGQASSQLVLTLVERDSSINILARVPNQPEDVIFTKSRVTVAIPVTQILLTEIYARFRFLGAAGDVRLARYTLQAAIDNATRTKDLKTDGKRVIDSQITRCSLGNMIRSVEAAHAWLENVAYAIDAAAARGNLTLATEWERLSITASLLKSNAADTLFECCRESSRILRSGVLKSGDGSLTTLLHLQAGTGSILYASGLGTDLTLADSAIVLSSSLWKSLKAASKPRASNL